MEDDLSTFSSSTPTFDPTETSPADTLVSFVCDDADGHQLLIPLAIQTNMGGSGSSVTDPSTAKCGNLKVPFMSAAVSFFSPIIIPLLSRGEDTAEAFKAKITALEAQVVAYRSFYEESLAETKALTNKVWHLQEENRRVSRRLGGAIFARRFFDDSAPSVQPTTDSPFYLKDTFDVFNDPGGSAVRRKMPRTIEWMGKDVVPL